MFQKPRDLFEYIGLSFFGLAMMLLLVHSLGEVHGLMATVILLFVQTASSYVRISALQRDLNILQHQQAANGETVGGKV